MLYEITTDSYIDYEDGQDYINTCQEIFGITPAINSVTVLQQRLDEAEINLGHAFVSEAIWALIPEHLRLPFAIMDGTQIFSKEQAGRWHSHLLELTYGENVHFFENETFWGRSFWAWRFNGRTMMVSKGLLQTLVNICNGPSGAFEVRCIK